MSGKQLPPNACETGNLCSIYVIIVVVGIDFYTPSRGWSIILPAARTLRLSKAAFLIIITSVFPVTSQDKNELLCVAICNW